jgi:hypothetical protein
VIVSIAAECALAAGAGKGEKFSDRRGSFLLPNAAGDVILFASIL